MGNSRTGIAQEPPEPTFRKTTMFKNKWSVKIRIIAKDADFMDEWFVRTRTTAKGITKY